MTDMGALNKNAIIVLLVIMIILLLYRIFDLGVTITYLEDDFGRCQNMTLIIQRFHRSRCIPVDKIAKEFYAFEKDGDFIIGGVKFECRLDKDRNEKIFIHK